MLIQLFKYLTLTAFLTLSISSFGQKKDMELKAKQLFDKGEYDTAISIYKSLYKQSPNYTPYYNNLLNSFVRIKRYDSADSLVDI